MLNFAPMGFIPRRRAACAPGLLGIDAPTPDAVPKLNGRGASAPDLTFSIVDRTR